MEFLILEEISSKYPELVELVKKTESMDDGERQYWFDILPSMTDVQIDRLYEILKTEKEKLDEFELKYQEEIKNLNEKHLIEWQEYQRANLDGRQTVDDSREILAVLNSL